MKKEQIRKAIIDRLCRNAIGYKQPAFHSKNITQQERDDIVEVIEEMTEYIRHYEDNKKIIEEHKNWNYLYTDDGR